MAADQNTIPGRVIELLTNAQVRVELENGKVLRCYLAGKLKMHSIRVVIGDRVRVVLPPQSEIGRVVYRL